MKPEIDPVNGSNVTEELGAAAIMEVTVVLLVGEGRGKGERSRLKSLLLTLCIKIELYNLCTIHHTNLCLV